MGARHKRRTTPRDATAMREFAELAFPGRGSFTAQARLHRLLDIGDRLGMTSGDTVRLGTETLYALDAHGELEPAIYDVLEAFDAGRLITEVREPMNLYLDRPAVSALAVAVCQTCRPGIAMAESATEARAPEYPAAAAAEARGDVEPVRPSQEGDPGPVQHGAAALWPERNRDGFPQMTLDVTVWWPGLPDWEPATLTASVSQSLAFSGENFTLLIEQAGDAEPARTNAVWLLKREDLAEDLPVYELRASTWEGGDDAHQYRFLVASSSPWCAELHDYLATRWVSKGQSPTGPEQFDAVILGGDHPAVRPLANR